VGLSLSWCSSQRVICRLWRPRRQPDVCHYNFQEFGSEGDTVAENVAQYLGYHLVDKAIVGALLSQYGLVEFDKEYDVLPGFRDKFSAQKSQRRDQMVAMLNQIVRPSRSAAMW